jgi:hypothetical protein
MRTVRRVISGVGIGVVAREHDDRHLETVPAQDAHGFAAIDVGQADIHDAPYVLKWG